MESATDRYVAAATRRVPANEREDIAAELRASIDDAVAARLEQDPDETPVGAERRALLEVGDPATLEAQYSGRPLWLIGPRAFPAWRRTLTLLLCTLAPIAMISAAVATSLGYEGRSDDGAAPSAFAQALLGDVALTGVNAIVHICFWCTLLFLVLDRRGLRMPLTWSPDRLAPTSGRREGTVGLISAAVTGALVLAIVAIDALVGLNVVAGYRIPILSPSLGLWWIALVCAIVACGLLLAGVTWQRGPSRGTAYANLAICGVTAVAILALLVSQRLVNDSTWETLFRLRFADHAQTVAIGSVFFGVITVVVATWRIVRGFRSARRRPGS